MKIGILIALLALGFNVQATEVNCTQLGRNDVTLNKDGKLFVTNKDGSLKALSQLSSTSEKAVYSDPSGGSALSLGTHCQYTVTKVSGKPSSMEEKCYTNWLVDGGSNTRVYDVGFNKDNNCYLKSQKNMDEKSIEYDSGLCRNLADLLTKIASPGEIEKCSQILNQMSTAVRNYKSTLLSGWHLDTEVTPQGNIFEKTLVFASECRKKLGYGGSEKDSLQIPSTKSEAGAR